MEDVKQNTNNVLKPRVRIIFGILIVVILSVITIFFLFKSTNVQIINTVYYSENSNLDYKVYLKENNYFKDKYLNKDLTYITSLIDYIDIDFLYNYSASDVFNFNYDYLITLELIITEKNNPKEILFTKYEDILSKKNNSIIGVNAFTINENIKIDYQHYNNIVLSFKRDYTLSVDSNLYINFNVFMNGMTNKLLNEVKNSSKIKINIPLSKQIIDINSDYIEKNNSSYTEKNDKRDYTSVIYIILGLITLIINIFIIIRIVKLILKTEAKKTYYVKKLRKILHDYDQIIVKSKKRPNLNKYNIIYVENFEEMLDAKNNTNKSIIMIETIKNKRSEFIIIDNLVVYIYLLEDKKDR